MMKKTLLIAAVALSMGMGLTGCATSSGNANIKNESVVSQIQSGKSTKADVQKLLGSPQYDEPDSNGDSVWTYQHLETSAVNMIPFATLVKGDMSAEQNLIVRFGSDGVVKGVGKGGHQF